VTNKKTPINNNHKVPTTSIKCKKQPNLLHSPIVHCFHSPLNTTTSPQQKLYHPIPRSLRKILKKHLPQSVAMIKGHLDQSRQNQQCTKAKVTFKQETKTNISSNNTDSEQQTNDDFWPTSETNNEQTYHCYTTEDPVTGKIFTDQMVRFTIPSNMGNTQLFILYDYDSNSIHTEPIKNCSVPEIL